MRWRRALRSARLGINLVIALICGGCAIFASKAELRLVQQMQTESDPITRTEALGRYDTEFGPSGRLGDRVEKLRREIDDDYWAYNQDLGLKQEHVDNYLARFPEGEHKAEAVRRADQLRFFAEADEARRQAKLRAEEEERQRVEEENERQRARVRGGLERWLRTALQVPRWGTTVEALAALDDSFREQWTGDPAPVCVGDTCRRTLEAFYFFAQTGGTRLDRSISLVLQVDVREGRVYRLRGYYTGRGFVDWLEMGSESPIVEATEEERDMARDAMMAMFQGAVSTLLTGASEVEEPEEEGVLLEFRRGDIVATLREFPPTFAAGRVDGFEVTFEGDLTAQPAPTPEEAEE